MPNLDRDAEMLEAVKDLGRALRRVQRLRARKRQAREEGDVTH